MYPHTSNHQGYEPSRILMGTSQRWGEPIRNIQISQRKGGEKDREGAKTWGVLDGHNMFLYMMSVHVSDIPKFFGAESPRSLFKMPRFP